VGQLFVCRSRTFFDPSDPNSETAPLNHALGSVASVDAHTGFSRSDPQFLELLVDLLKCESRGEFLRVCWVSGVNAGAKGQQAAPA
jgi:hypothetical protein